MSVKRTFIWTCDFCGMIRHKEAYKLPDGWIVVPDNVLEKKETQHCCPDCKSKLTPQ